MSQADVAGLMYAAFHTGGYGRSFATAKDRSHWLAAAAAVIQARETGRL